MTLDVVAAVIERDGHYLLAQRPPGKVYAGWWEFPGGKVEAGETCEAALARELQEELGMRPTTVYPWITRIHAYEHATVRLRFFRVTGWEGEPAPREGQVLTWQRPGAEDVGPMLPANAPVLAALALPRVYAITDATGLGVDRQLKVLQSSLDAGLALVCIREPGMDASARTAFTEQVIRIAHERGARVIVKQGGECPDADGIHLTSREMLALSRRPHFRLVGASCHAPDDLRRAEALGLDFAVLGPVLETASHPGARTLGWDGFSRMVTGAGIPVYAIGGVETGDLVRAWQSGAHGTAMIRAAWRVPLRGTDAGAFTS